MKIIHLVDFMGLFSRIDCVSDVEVKNGLIWMFGTYCHLIENAKQILQHFIGNFQEEAASVRGQIAEG